MGDEEDHGRKRGEDVVLLASGEREEGERQDCPEDEEEAGALVGVEFAGEEAGAEGAGGERQGAGQGSGEEGGPGHEPDEDEAEEEPEGDGVVVTRDAEVEVAENLLVDEVEPGPAVDVAVGGERHGQWPLASE